MDKFLNFWSHHNVAIIEILIGAILVISLYVAWKSLFGKSEATEGHSESVHIDTAHIEEALKKILENQEKAPAAPSFDMSSMVSGGDVSPELIAKMSAAQAEVVRLAGDVETRSKQIETLQLQVAEAEKKAELAAAAGASGAAPAAFDSSALEAKIKDLQSRLEEYEIISEDIADISKYKEENVALSDELKKLKEQLANGGGASGGIPIDASLDIPSDVAALMEQPVVIDEPVTAETPATESVTVAEPAAEEAFVPDFDMTPIAEDPAAPVEITDDLMAEFEAAVAQQQQGDLKNEPDAPSTVEASVAEPSKESEVVKASPDGALAETEELIGEFENFIKKG